MQQAVARRLGAICSAINVQQKEGAWSEWAPTTTRAVGSYAAQVFTRLPLNAWTTDGRLHHREGSARCRFGCPEQPGDLRHDVCCARAWIPTFRALGMHEGPHGKRAWPSMGSPLRVYRAYSILRHDTCAEVASAIVVGADHARSRIPPGTGEGRGGRGERPRAQM